MDWLHCIVLNKYSILKGKGNWYEVDFKILLFCMFSAYANKMDSVLFSDTLAFTEGSLMGTECTSCLISNLLRINANCDKASVSAFRTGCY